MKDHELLAALRKGGASKERAWEYIYYKWRGLWLKKIINAGGTADEAEEANSEASYRIIEAFTKDGFQQKGASLKTYYTVSVYRQWLATKIRNKLLEINEMHLQEAAGSVEDLIASNELKKWMEIILNVLSKRCKAILTLWSMKYSMAEIAQMLAIRGGAKEAKKNKYECLKKLVDWLKKHPHLMQLLRDFFND